MEKMHFNRNYKKTTYFFCIALLYLSSYASDRNLFSELYKKDAPSEKLYEINSLIEAFMTGTLRCSLDGEQMVTEYSGFSNPSEHYKRSHTSATQILFGVYQRVGRAKSAHMKPTFILDSRTGDMFFCDQNISQVQALRLYDFIKDKLYISDKTLEEYSLYVSDSSDEQIVGLQRELEKVAQSIIQDRKKYFTAFAQKDISSFERAVKNKIDWDHVSCQQYMVSMNNEIKGRAAQQAELLFKEVIAFNECSD